MKIAVSAAGNNLESQVDPRFGRAAWVLIVDPDDWSFSALDNSENLNALKGAGIQAAAMICDHQAQVLLTGHCGPNAFKALAAGGVKVANNADRAGTVRRAVEEFLAGALPVAEAPDVEGQW